MTKSTKSKTVGVEAQEAAVDIVPKGKLGAMIALMRRPEGARLDEMQTVTGWQAHSVRGAMAGAIKKKRGLNVTSEKTDAGRVYRIIDGAGA